MKRALWTLLWVGAVALAGCSPKGDNPTPPTSQPAPSAPTPPSTAAGGDNGKKYTIGMSQCNLGEPWRVQMNADIKAAADAHPNITMVWRDAQNKSETQQSQVQEFIQQKVDLLIISPKESRPLTKPVADAMDAGIPVIVLDRAIEGDKYTCFIGGDNVKIGRELGKYMVQALGGKGNVVELKGLMTSVPAEDRHSQSSGEVHSAPRMSVIRNASNPHCSISIIAAAPAGCMPSLRRGAPARILPLPTVPSKAKGLQAIREADFRRIRLTPWGL